jgi:hypothetical protein
MGFVGRGQVDVVCRGARRAAGADVECVAVHGGAVGVLPLDKNETNGGRRY